MFQEAIELQKQGDHAAAAKQLEEILIHVPEHIQVLSTYAQSLAELGDVAAAVKTLEKAIKCNPGFTEGWIRIGLIQQGGGNFEAAAEAYKQFSTFNPSLAVGHLNFANACQLLNRFDEAETAYERALAIEPDNPVAWSNLCRASLHLGDWKKSENAANRALTLAAGHTGVLALKSIALAELGKASEVAELVDFDRLIEKSEFGAPETYADLASFNQALCEHCLSHSSLVFEPSDNTTMKGHQTGNLSLDEDTGPIGPLLEMIDKAVRNYQEAHPIDPSHPFLAHHPSQWQYDIWGTVLGSQGHQASHIHRSGWLSGCYYASIPDVITADSGDQAGWIEFGHPQDYPNSKAEPVVRSYQPHEGMVVLFPSYFYHRTKPFASQDKRISIAFDILPIA